MGVCEKEESQAQVLDEQGDACSFIILQILTETEPYMASLNEENVCKQTRQSWSVSEPAASQNVVNLHVSLFRRQILTFSK